MRRVLIPALLFGLSACSRNPAPAPVAAGSAMAPSPNSAAAQALPAGATPQAAPAPAPEAEAEAAGASAAVTSPVDARPDVDPDQFAVPEAPATDDFLAQQQQRDAELMQHDADEASALAADRRREADLRDQANDEPPRGYAPEYPPEYPPDERDQGEYPDPPPDDADDWGDEPPPDEDYDPRYDDGRR